MPGKWVNIVQINWSPALYEQDHVGGLQKVSRKGKDKGVRVRRWNDISDQIVI